MSDSGFVGYGNWFDDDIGTFRDWFSVWILFVAVAVLAWPFFCFRKALRLAGRIASLIWG